MSLYLWINLLSLSVPLLVSFHPRIQLYKRWKELFLAIGLSLIPYIIWDIYFTENGYWGFNDRYLTGIDILGLPIEEWLFFVCIPYACVFTHVALNELWGGFKLKMKTSKIITLILLGVFALVGIIFYSKAYTFLDMLFAFVILGIGWMINKKLISSYLITFLFMLIPFLIVNGLLTGSFIEEQVVWYNDMENLGLRIGTIPIEDFAYAFSLILLNLILFEGLRRKKAIN